MRKLAKKLSVFVCTLSLLALTACGSSPAQTQSAKPSESAESTPSSTGGKSISVGISNPPGTFNPIDARDVSAQDLTSILFESLFDMDESLNFLPKLAESLETKDNQNFIIKLNPQAKWTDGQPFTTEDIVFTLQLMANSKVTSIGLVPLSSIEGLDENGLLPEGQKDIKGISIVDPHTLSVQTKVPVDPNLIKEKLGYDIKFLPKHVLKDVEPEKLHLHPFMQKPDVSTGAFKFVKYAKNQYVEFSANKDYYRGAPKLDKLFFKVMPSANLVAQLQTGEIDMNSPEIGPVAVEDYEKVKNMSNVRTISGKPFSHQMMFFNTKTIPDPKVRQAILHAIDRQFLVDKLLKSEGEVFEGSYESTHPYYNENLEKHVFDPEKAKQLLQEAGWDSNKTIDFAVPSSNKTREQASVIIAENLRAVGLKVQINKYDIPTILQKAEKHEFDLFILGMPFYLDPDRGEYYQTGAIYNFSDYSRPQVDELVDKGKKEADPNKRRVIYDQILKITNDELPTAPIYAEYPLRVVSKKVKVGEPKSVGMFYNVHEWDIEK